jgi:threonine synthase
MLQYISTRKNHDPVTASQAIALGMVPDGGLFVPETVPLIDLSACGGKSYQTIARKILSPLLPDFSSEDIEHCVSRSYNSATFDVKEIVNIVPLDAERSIMELWHGPTAAFKDVALQIMPHFLATAKRNLGDTSHTVILVATSGDTGKAALEGFKNCKGISIIVFYPHEGVSEIQKLQMTTTDGCNTYVVAVKGNFDQCQNGVKQILGSKTLRKTFVGHGFTFSSANSINWGRLCPQIVYYWTSYFALAYRGVIKAGDKVNFCVPTGNFGNILAGYYAMRMGLPIGKLICASNKNNVLTDFFKTGRYDSNRTFYRTMSPSMDILISSNLERFLFEMTVHDASSVAAWSGSLADTGAFTVDQETRKRMNAVITSGWVDEPEVTATIARLYKKTGYVLDTHTAVAAALSERVPAAGNAAHTIIASTASPYKFSRHVLAGMTGASPDDEYAAINRIAELSRLPLHRALSNLRYRPILHSEVIEQSHMKETIIEIIGKINATGNK